MAESATGFLLNVLGWLASGATKDVRTVFMILRFAVSLGFAVMLDGCLLKHPLWLVVFLAWVAAVAHAYSYERLRDALYELALRVNAERINSAAGLKAYLFSVIHKRHSILQEALAGDLESARPFIKISLWVLLTAASFQAVLVLLIHIASRFLGIPLHSLGLGVGATLILLACTAALLVPSYALVDRRSSSPPRTHTHVPGIRGDRKMVEEATAFGRALANRYFFYNITPIRMRIIQVIGVLAHMPQIRVVQQLDKIGPVLLLCSEKMKDIIKERKETGLIEVEGDIEKFFKCDNIDGLEELASLQEADLGTVLDKLLGRDEKPGGSVLVVRVRDRPRGGRAVATVFMKAWRGRRASVNKRQKDNRVISLFAAGVKEYMWELYVNTLLATRLASEENLRIPGKKRHKPAKDP